MTLSPEQHLFVVSYSGELSVKAQKTRRRFTDRLAANLRQALTLEDVPHQVEPTWARLLLRSPSPRAGEIAARIFGVHSVWPAHERSWETLEDILRAGEEIFAPQVKDKTFAVRARRGDQKQKIPFRSPEVERRLGALLLPHAAGVDLKTPDVQVRVELRRGKAYYMGASVDGPGGFPLGTEGRAVALISGGFDSLVAAWLLMRRGITQEFVFCNLGGDAHRDSVFEVLEVLSDRWCFGYRPQLHMIDFQPVVDEIRGCCPQALWQVILKRQMLRAADRVARMRRAIAIVTGDAVGQVSSQTLHNLAAISTATELPILRPLAAHHKEEILEIARRVGTHDLSAKIPEYCAISPRRPETHAKPAAVAAAESGLDPERLETLIAERAVFDLRALDLAKLRAPALEVDEIPAGAVIVDLRPAFAFKSWHPAGAVHLEYVEALKVHGVLDRGKTYLFYCEVGLKSAHLAEIVHGAGGRAFHFRGGLKQLVRWTERQDPALRAATSPVLLTD
ncbi:MAG: tRNA uracil 4-sulfurtransferase ThiI [Thermoanaerobaculia bacterium]